MNKKVCFLLALVLSMPSIYAANAPIQRLDIVNLLWNDVAAIPGITDTAVQISFYNGESVPCLTTTLAFQAAMTLWVGIGQTCVKPIHEITVTPVANPEVIYDPAVTSTISSGYYATQVTVSQNSPPVFDPTNGAVLAAGSLKTTLINY